MRERREIAARPDASLLRNRRMQLRVEHGDEQLGEIRARPGVSFGNDVRSEQHHGADFALREQRADPRGVAPYEIDLQLAEPLDWDRDVGELAEASGDAVRRGVAGDEIVNDTPRGACTFARQRCQFHRRLARGHGKDIFDAERGSIDHDRRHGVNVAGRKCRYKGCSLTRSEQPASRRDHGVTGTRDSSTLPVAL